MDEIDVFKQALNDEELMKEMEKSLNIMFNGDEVNINPLTNIEEPQMKLYIVDYFKVLDNEIDLINYILSKKANKKYIRIIEYIKHFANKSDVIKITDLNNNVKYCCAVNEDGYVVYNDDRSIYTGSFIWEYELGDISDLYSEFRKRGIVFENDIYKKIDDRTNYMVKRLERRIRETYN